MRIRLALGLLLLSCGSFGNDFCAVTVRVLEGDTKQPLRSALPVSLLDAAGTVVAQTELNRGEAQFCDFGFGRHSILIGEENICRSVQIKSIRYRWLEPQTFVAVLNRCIDEADGVMTGCLISFRVSDLNSKPIPFPVLRRVQETIRGTQHGFIPTSLRLRESGEFLITADGLNPKTVMIPCSAPHEIEQVVILQPTPKK